MRQSLDVQLPELEDEKEVIDLPAMGPTALSTAYFKQETEHQTAKTDSSGLPPIKSMVKSVKEKAALKADMSSTGSLTDSRSSSTSRSGERKFERRKQETEAAILVMQSKLLNMGILTSPQRTAVPSAEELSPSAEVDTHLSKKSRKEDPSDVVTSSVDVNVDERDAWLGKGVHNNSILSDEEVEDVHVLDDTTLGAGSGVAFKEAEKSAPHAEAADIDETVLHDKSIACQHAMRYALHLPHWVSLLLLLLGI